MKPNEHIKAQVRTIVNSQNFHMLIVEGRPGTGKSTAISAALNQLGIAPAILGAYSTPLGFFNFLSEHPSSVVLADDTSGILASPLAMAILKSATWDQPGHGRVVRWVSTTERAVTEEILFSGKLIFICNSFPKTPDAEAVRNRSLDLLIEPNVAETKELLTLAAKDKERFPDQKIAQRVLKKIISDLSEENLSKVSYRNLQKAYEIAVHNPQTWEQMGQVKALIGPEPESIQKVINKLNQSKLKVKDQLNEFERITGFKRRTFFKYRKQLGL
jgi:DNA polymerase III delta prime subunit